MLKRFFLFLFFTTGIISTCFADTKEPERRAPPAPLDSIFPSSEYLGPTIGVPNADPTSALTKALWKKIPTLLENKIWIYGWLNPSFNLSTSNNSNGPMSDDLIPNMPELDQFMLRIERPLDTVQTDHVDWGFRLSNLFGMDYRFNVSQGIFSNQLLQQNNLYGYDPIEAYGQVYLPNVAEGMVLTFGRFNSPADIEAITAPDNYLFTHSLMGNVSINTMTGFNAAIKFSNQWTLILGMNAGGDVAPWAAGANIPTGQAVVRWVSKNNNDSVLTGVTAINNGFFKGNHDNLQEFNFTWTHRFTEAIHMATEVYYMYQYNAVVGGTCSFGPVRSYGGGGGCGEPIPGISPEWAAVNFLEFKISKKDFLSLRTDYLNDTKGELTGYATPYMSYTFGLTHRFTPTFMVRPEVRYEQAFSSQTPYNNGTRKSQTSFDVDAVYQF